MSRRAATTASGVDHVAAPPSRCSPARRLAYQSHRLNVAVASSASAGLRMAIVDVYVRGPVIDAVTSGSMPLTGTSRPTRCSTCSTTSGGSPTANVESTITRWSPAGWLRFVNVASASMAFGMMRTPSSVSMCTERQLTSTMRPRSPSASSQSPSLNGCSNSSSRPLMIDPTAFWSAKPSTIVVTPSAANRPPTLAPRPTRTRGRAR